jgi:hypothetical protein
MRCSDGRVVLYMSVSLDTPYEHLGYSQRRVQCSTKTQSAASSLALNYLTICRVLAYHFHVTPVVCCLGSSSGAWCNWAAALESRSLTCVHGSPRTTDGRDQWCSEGGLVRQIPQSTPTLVCCLPLLYFCKEYVKNGRVLCRL